MFDRLNKEPGANEVPVSAGASKDRLRDMLKQAVKNTGGQPVIAAASPRAAEDRRFVDKAALDPSSVRSLPINHPALLENRTLFPSTVVNVDEDFSDRLLVSGKNNRKLGERITKGMFKGYALYGLSLEERATCPTDCSARAFCYGNGMQMARRHRISDLDLFNAFLEDDIRTILADPVQGLMVRLHVLGDFPSIEYVALWADLLETHERLACYGYTHRRGAIGDAIESLKSRYPSRFRIRWSSQTPIADGAVIIDRVPTEKRVKEGIVCPAQTDAAACCSSCGLCWEGSAKKDSIVFIKHGPKSLEAAAVHAKMAATAPNIEREALPSKVTAAENVRAIAGISIPQKRDIILSEPPAVRMMRPTELKIESAYQRDLSSKSINLIRRIIIGWDWAKYKPPICAETDDGVFIIDGQHTAIAAASRPEIHEIPVMIVAADRLVRRAEAFVAHNRDRLTMTAAQILHADAAAGRVDAVGALKAVERAGGTVPRLPIAKNYASAGQITAIGELRSIFTAHGEAALERVVRIATLSKVAPVSKTVLGALRYLLTEASTSDLVKRTDKEIASALASIDKLEASAQAYALESGQGRVRAAAVILAKRLRGDQQ